MLAACAKPGTATTAAAPGAWGGPGLQLFTVMTDLERDFEGTLAAVAAIGYREVETIGAFGRDPAWVRAQFDAHGLVSPSQHLVPGDLYSVFKRFAHSELGFEEVRQLWTRAMTTDLAEPIIDEAAGRARILGQKYLVWQIIWPEEMADRTALAKFCDGMNRAGARCREAGLVFCFHNHADEFAVRDGVVPFDFILDNTDPATVKIELDAHWVRKGGRDPVRYLERHADRIVQCHLKDGTPDGEITTIGRGVIDFPALIAAARRAGIEHMYVEYDLADDPMGAIRESWDHLSRLR